MCQFKNYKITCLNCGSENVTAMGDTFYEVHLEYNDCDNYEVEYEKHEESDKN